MGLVEGLSPTEIADVMRVSTKTVSEYRHRVAEKLGAQNTLHAIAVWAKAEDQRMTAKDLLKAVYEVARDDVLKGGAQNSGRDHLKSF